MFVGNAAWKAFKVILQGQITSLEPYTESVPFMTTLWVYETAIKDNHHWGSSGHGRGSNSYNIFVACSIFSLLSANFGIVKFFKRGPVRFLPSTGTLDGFLALQSLAKLPPSSLSFSSTA